MKVTLNYQEQVIVKEIALARHLTNIDKERKDMKVGDGDDLQINIEGLAGEFAFCKLKNIYPDMSIECPLPFDCKIEKLGFIEVKTTKYQHGHLVVGIWKKDYPVPAYFALMVGEIPTLEFKGYFPGNQMFFENNIKNFGKGPTYAISQDRLIMDL